MLLAWGVLILAVWHVVAMGREGLQQAQAMHQIPCADCKFFTNEPTLKCSVHPIEALSEQAIGCPDFEIANPMWAAYLHLKETQRAGQDNEQVVP